MTKAFQIDRAIAAEAQKRENSTSAYVGTIIFLLRGRIASAERHEAEQAELAELRRKAAEQAAKDRAMPVAPPFPEPMREAPMLGTAIWYADPVSDQYCGGLVWDVREKVFQDHILNCGLCHATQEPAAAHGRYLASLSAKPEGGHD